ncbi:LSU ribosomal protein L6p (L9e) [hydrothermal vent metagenome]|uniref:LSU ribosomal protein L6p (L9e) n=1 Tax=hydrothermal vent metagenome TaxID=652676 RepID=A0A1W1BKB8_9ZZZZ
MPRIAKESIIVPTGVEVKAEGQSLVVKGKLGEINFVLHPSVAMKQSDNELNFSIVDLEKKHEKGAWAQAGTARSIINNCIKGVSEGFEKKLILNGVGYRAQIKGKVLNLTLGFSHPIDYIIPEGIKIESPSQTEIVIKGYDKQKVGQVAAEIRKFRPPEPYKGKGVRYVDEHIVRKEAKKK